MNAVRSGLRSGLLGIALAEVAAGFGMRRLRAGAKGMCIRDRAEWLQGATRTVLRRVGVRVRAEGQPPPDGLVVSNHLTYLDVLAFASVMPCIFVAKQEVRLWPVFGHFATMAGTIFVDRRRPAANGDAAAAMEEALAADVPVVLFPEGTSSDGRALLPFYSGFFEPAVRANAVVIAAAIGYASRTADEAALAYCGDDIFGPHLVRTLGHRSVETRMIFSTERTRYSARKDAAQTTRAEVERLRRSIAGMLRDIDPLLHSG